MSAKDITFSDGVTLTVAPNSFGFRQADNPGNGKNDTQPPSAPGTPVATNITQSSASLHWEAAWDNVGVSRYSVNVDNQTYTTTSTSLNISGLKAATTYSATVIAEDAMGNISAASISNFTTEANSSGGTNPLPYIRELDNGDVQYNVTFHKPCKLFNYLLVLETQACSFFRKTFLHLGLKIVMALSATV